MVDSNSPSRFSGRVAVDLRPADRPGEGSSATICGVLARTDFWLKFTTLLSSPSVDRFSMFCRTLAVNSLAVLELSRHKSPFRPAPRISAPTTAAPVFRKKASRTGMIRHTSCQLVWKAKSDVGKLKVTVAIVLPGDGEGTYQVSIKSAELDAFTVSSEIPASDATVSITISKPSCTGSVR